MLDGYSPFPAYNNLLLSSLQSLSPNAPRDLLIIHLLALELRQTRSNISPLLLSVDQAGDGADDVVEAGAHLLCRVAVAQGECVILDGLEVDGDAEGRTEFVVALDRRCVLANMMC
jgi:hypothetical protein